MKRVKRVSILIGAVTALAASAAAANLPAPTQANVAYGKHERHVLDFWQAKSAQPAPLAIFIHGGGFAHGSKEGLNPRELQELLEAGISVASINYRLLSHAPLPAAHQDATRAVQFLRSKAGEWNLDPTRVGGFGASAGAQLVMYLAFHDDLAQPDSADPIARESSRLACVAPSRGQTSIASSRRTSEVFGTADEAATRRIVADIAAVSLISADDPPVFMRYSMAPDDRTKTNPIHHVSYGVELKNLCDKLGVECHLLYPGAQSAYLTDVQFLKAKLLGAGGRSAARPPATQVKKEEPATRPPARGKTTRSEGAAPAWLEPDRSEPAGMKYRSFYSQAAKSEVSYLVYLPPGYDADATRRYPVVYWLHGRGGHQRAAAGAAAKWDAAIQAGRAAPVILVGVNGLPYSSYVDSFDGKAPVQTMIVGDLIPHIDATYRTIARREARALEGFSMGGAGAAKIGFRHPELFGIVSILAGALHDADSIVADTNKSRSDPFTEIYGGSRDYFQSTSPWVWAEKNAAAIRGRTPVRVIVGDRDPLLPRVTAYHQFLDRLGIPHEFEVIEGASHNVSRLYAGLGDRYVGFVAEAFTELAGETQGRPPGSE